MQLINCEINLILIWSENGVISSATGETNFKITDTKLYVPVVTLLNQDNAKLLEQLKSGFKRKINRNKCQSKVLTQIQNQCLDLLIFKDYIDSLFHCLKMRNIEKHTQGIIFQM